MKTEAEKAIQAANLRAAVMKQLDTAVNAPRTGQLSMMRADLGESSRRAKNAITILNRPNITEAAIAGLEDATHGQGNFGREAVDELRSAIASKLKRLRANPDVGPVAARVANVASKRTGNLFNRLGVAVGDFPKLLRGAVIPPIDMDQAENSYQDFILSKLGKGA